jgi:signal transduction histidine kinase
MRRMPRWLFPILTTVLVTLVMAFDRGRTFELPVRDFAMRLMDDEPARATVVVAIDERSLKEIGPWPWDRGVLAEIVSRAADSGAKAVVLDILLAEERAGDEQLANAMKRIPTIAVSVLVEREQWIVPAPKLRAPAVVAHGNFELDHDGILRRFASTKQNRDNSYTALSIAAASILESANVPVGRSVAPAFRTAPREVPVVSATDVIWHRTPAGDLRNRLVFVGPTALGLGDRVLTPVSTPLAPDPGVTVHAAAAEALVRGERIRELPPIVSGIVAGVFVAGLLRTRALPRTRRIAIAAVLFMAVIAGGYLLLAILGIAVPFVVLMLTVSIAAAAHETTLMRASLEESGVQLEEIATRLAEQRAHDVESKRLLAHELKTPLASMRNLTQLLGDFELSANEQRRVAKLLQSEAGKLQSMVDALLDLERLPLRDFATSTRPTDLGELVRARVDVLRESAHRSVLATAPDGVIVQADPLLLERVVDNLVGNALKYTPAREPVEVTVQTTANSAILEVADRGPGIAAEDRERIFQRFFRGATAAGTEGLGLGLSLVAEVARWHGGTVAVDRAASGGALFRFELPLQKEGNA